MAKRDANGRFLRQIEQTNAFSRSELPDTAEKAVKFLQKYNICLNNFIDNGQSYKIEIVKFSRGDDLNQNLKFHVAFHKSNLCWMELWSEIIGRTPSKYVSVRPRPLRQSKFSLVDVCKILYSISLNESNISIARQFGRVSYKSDGTQQVNDECNSVKFIQVWYFLKYL